MNVGNKGI